MERKTDSKKNQPDLLDVCTRAGLIGIGCANLWIFSNIWRFGSHFVNEPNRLILVCEILLIVALVVLGLRGLAKTLPKRKGRRIK